MNFIQKWRLRRRILEGSAVVEERIRKRLENLQQKLEQRRDDLEAQAKRQDERARQLDAKAESIEKKISNANAKLEQKELSLQEKQLKLEENIAKEKAKLDQKAELQEEKANRLAARESNIETRTANLDERRDSLNAQSEELRTEKSELLAIKNQIIDEIDRNGGRISPELGSEVISKINMGGFDESGYLEKFAALMDDEAFEDALDHVVDEMPSMARSNLHRKEKLNHMLFSNRRLQHAGIAKHGWEKLLRKAGTANRAFSEAQIDKNSTFLDLGCGTHDPVALSAYYYLNGFNRTIACDLQEPRTPVYSAFSMYDIIAHMNLFPKDFCLEGTHSLSFEGRLDELQAKAFADGQWDQALAALDGKIEHKAMNVLDLPVADNELGFAVSFAVLEHVEDINAVMEWLYRKSKPGAVQFHFIDLADHRSYTPGSGADAWTFLTEKTAPQGMNRLRKSEHIAAIEKAGFQILSANDSQEELPTETSAKLIKPWKSMSEDDLETTKLTVVIQK
jgi:SAM-dependent methyltransferase